MKKELILENRLITEITRQLELMGIKPLLLNEQPDGKYKVPFLKQAIHGIVELFPKTPIEEIVAGNAGSLVKQLKSEGIQDAEQLLKRMETGNGLVFVQKNLNLDFVKYVARKIFIDSKFSVIARKVIGEFLSNFKSTITLSNGEIMTLEDASKAILGIDLKKHPDVIYQVEYLYKEVVEKSGLGEKHESMQFLRKQINDSKKGIHPSNAVDNSIDDVIDDIPSNTTTDVVTDIPNNGLKPIPNQVPNNSVGKLSLTTLTTKIIGKNINEILKKIKISGVMFADEVSNTFSKLLNSSSELVGENLVFYSAVIRKIFPQSLEQYIQSIRAALKQKGKEPLMKQLETAVGNENVPVNEIVAWTKKELGIELSPTTVQVWRDKILNVGIVDGVIQIRIPGNLLRKEANEILRSIKQGGINFLKGIGGFFVQIGVGLTEGPPLGYIFKRIYLKNMPEVATLRAQAMVIFESIHNKIARGEGADIQPDLDELYKLLYSIGKRRDTARKTIYKEWMNALKNEKGPEGQNYAEFFNKESEFYFENWTDDSIKDMMKQYESITGIEGEINVTVSKWEGTKRLFGKGAKGSGIWNRLGRVVQRLIGVLIAWTPNTLAENRRNWRALGWDKWIAKGIGQKIYMAAFIIPEIIAIERTVASMYIAYYNRNERLKPSGKGITMENIKWLGMDEKSVIDLVGKDYKSYGSAAVTLIGRNWAETAKYGILPFFGKLETWSPAAEFLSENFNSGFSFGKFKTGTNNAVGLGKEMQQEIREAGKKDPKLQKIIDSSKVLSLDYDSLFKKTTEKANEQILELDQNNN